MSRPSPVLKAAVPRLSSLVLLSLLLGTPGQADPLPPTSIRYRIKVRVDPSTRRLTGDETLTWVNRSSRAVDRVPLHLYLNAFAHMGTTWMKEAEVYFPGWVDRDRLLRRYPDPWGWNEPTAMQQVVDRAKLEASWRAIQPDDGNPLDRTLIEVRLPRPVPPGESLTLRVVFAGRLPVPIARTGCRPDFCLVAQWFPKIAALDPHRRGRFAARQFHAPTEFFADFADYEVTIEAPRGWTVGATGKRRARRVSGAWQRVRHSQRAVHDFAIVLGRELHEARARHRAPGAGGSVDVRYLLPRGLAHQVPRARRAIERALDLFARRVGPYPYETLTVVMPPWPARQTGGMEYPTLITGSPADPLWDRFPVRHFRALEFTLVHELGHQYFYGLLASNEQQEAFLDEGLNSHWDGRAMQALFGERASAGWVLGRPVDAVELYRHAMARDRKRVMEPVRRRPSALFYPGSQRDQIYGRSALTLWTAARRFGVPTLDRVFAAYYKRYRFQHPDAEAFLAAARESGGASIAAFLDEAISRERVPDFRVVALTSEEHLPPLGHVVIKKDEVVTVTEQDRQRLAGRLTDPRTRDADGKVWVQITDPGWTRGGGHVDGTVRWVGFERRGGSAAKPERYYESRARIVGPAWDHLPVTVLLRFDDGVELRERWDGRAAWRGYRVIRGARLAEVRLDESGHIAIDVLPGNNALKREGSRRFTADWTGWLAAVASWIAGGLSLWL